MSRRSSLPRVGAPSAAPSAAPSRVVSSPDGTHAEYSGTSVSSLLNRDLPIAEKHDAIASSPNLARGVGGDPVVSAVDIDSLEAAPRVVKRYRVLGDKPKNVSGPGYRFNLNPGKELDEANFDIPGLRRQGVKLEEITG